RREEPGGLKHRPPWLRPSYECLTGSLTPRAARDTAQEERERHHEHPFRPEIAAAAGCPDEDGDHVQDSVLDRERTPADVPRAQGPRGLLARALPEGLLEVAGRAGVVHLVEPGLELVHRQPAAVVVLAELVRRSRAIGVRDERVELVGHGVSGVT